MSWKIEVKDKNTIFDAIGAGIKKDILDLGIAGIKDVSFVQVYNIEGDVTLEQVKKICEELLVDKICQDYSIVDPDKDQKQGRKIIEVAYNPGVMDPSEGSILKGIKDLGINTVREVKTAKKYIFEGEVTEQKIKLISDKLLYNKLIQHIVSLQSPVSSLQSAEFKFNLVTVDLVNASEARLSEISKKGQLFLNIHEMRQIQRYFKKVKRNPTDCELETVAQTWSEHCMHKTFRGKIRYSEKLKGLKPKKKLINNLLKSTIMKATKKLNKPWCVSVFHDNSGVINFDDKYNVCFKVETHNHPSALEPFGGANTGIGGVIRDPMGTGLGAKPILNTDVFCFAPPEFAFSKLPKGTLHPKRIMKGVVSGVRDYGNKMGIPTVNGAVHFHERFVGNPLVYCGTVGIMPKDKTFKKVNIGDLVVVVGGRTGRDGIHGATFSSGELTHESEVVSSGAVQIGNPIQEKKMLDCILAARDLNLYSAITDCGAGGLSSAVGEMGADSGVEVNLEKVPLKYSGLNYTEIWISESQERMVLSVPKENAEKLVNLFASENVEATIIGEFTDSKRLKLFYEDNLVCDLDMKFLHDGLPQIEKIASFEISKHREPKLGKQNNLTQELLKLLSRYDICSKEWIIRQYDHEVQGGSVLKPLCGIKNDGPSDAAVARPVYGSDKGIIVSCGINFRFGFIDPYWMAAASVDEALRQIIAVGGSIEKTAILDNFCWGNPDKSDRLGGLVRAALGCLDASLGYGVPFISGKDSLYNEYTVHNKSISIPGTLLISAISVMDNVNKSISMYLKKPGNLIYIVGETKDELGGSHYFESKGFIGNSVPEVNFKQSRMIFNSLSKASCAGLIASMHDCSDGGLAVACSEMAFAGGLGVDIFLSEVPFKAKDAKNKRNDFILFSESCSRFIVEVDRKKQKEFEKTLKGIPFCVIGCVNDKNNFTVFGLDSKPCIKVNIDKLKEAWQKPLRW